MRVERSGSSCSRATGNRPPKPAAAGAARDRDVAVVGLTATVVILATDETDMIATDKSASAGRQASALSAQAKKWRAFTDAINSMTPTERARAFSAQSVAPGARYDNGPEGKTREPRFGTD